INDNDSKVNGHMPVGGSLPANYGSTVNGDTIVVTAGEYSGDVNVKKGITIKGVGDDTKINGKITINATSDVALTDFRLTYGDEAAVKVPSEVSLNSLTLKNMSIVSDKAIFIADSKDTQSTIGTLSITNSTI